MQYTLLRYLCDGKFHSGETLAQQLGVSRTAIWKSVKVIQRRFNLRIDAVNGRGYRLAHPVELLDATIIRQALQPSSKACDIQILFSIDSTNRYLLELAAKKDSHEVIVFAEYQTAGKGRLGRTWVSPFGANIYFSLLWKFKIVPAALSGLGLAIGVAIARVLRHLAVPDVKLKWPNDILCQGRKLCGILIEMQGEMSASAMVVIGVGLNVKMTPEDAEAIDQPWIDLQRAGGIGISRNQLAAALINEIISVLILFEECGLQPFLAEWRDFDCYKDQSVILQVAEQKITGIARGIDDNGALLLEDQRLLRRFYSGDVRLREG